MERKRVGVFVVMALFLAGCAHVQFATEPRVLILERDAYKVQVRPAGRYALGSYEGFELSVSNKTDSDIEIVWNKTLFIKDGVTNGGFMFTGVVYEDRNDPKPSDVVFAHDTFSKCIWPCNLVMFTGTSAPLLPQNTWWHRTILAGEHGVYLTLKVADHEVHEKLTIRFYRN